MSVMEIVNFVFTYVILPIILTVYHLYQVKKSEDQGNFDICMSVFLLYSAFAVLINYFTGDATKYVAGLAIFIAIKDAILEFKDGLLIKFEYSDKKRKKWDITQATSVAFCFV